MIKRLQNFWERLQGDKGRLKATVRVEFYPHRTAYSSVVWHDSGAQERDLVGLMI